MTPDSSALTGEGAAGWASGSQKKPNGKIPAFVANPIKNRARERFNITGDVPIINSIDFDGVTEVFSPDGQYIASVSYDRKKILIKNTNDDLLVKELIIEQGCIYGIDW